MRSNKSIRRLLAMILSIVMALSLAIPAFAAEIDDSGPDLEAIAAMFANWDGSYELPDLSELSPEDQEVVKAMVDAIMVAREAENTQVQDEVPLVTGFSDVNPSNGFYDAILWAASKGIVGGYADKTFRPTNSVTRAQFCVMLSRAFYPNEIKKYNTDAYKGTWFGPNAKALSAAGVLTNTSFQYAFGDAGVMDRTISRYDMAQLMVNIMAKKGFTATNTQKTAAQAKITDYKNIPSKYQNAVKTVYALGIIGGYGDGSFKGDITMNRGQGAVVIYRMAKYTPAANAGTPGTDDGGKPTTGTGNTGSTGTSTGNTGNTGNTNTGSNTGSTSTDTTGKLANGKPITEANVLAMLNELMAKYPSGTLYAPVGTKVYTTIYYQTPNHASYGIQCAGWAAMANDYIFGKTAPVRVHTNFNQVRVGDVFYSTEHKMVVTGTAKCVVCGNIGYTVTQSGSSYLTSWDGMDICPTCGDITHYTNSEIITRYPTNSTVPYLSLSGTAKPGPRDNANSSSSNAGSSSTGNSSSSSETTTQPSTGTGNNSYAAWSANKTCDLCGGVTPTWTLSADRSRHICENCAKTTAGKNYIA